MRGAAHRVIRPAQPRHLQERHNQRPPWWVDHAGQMRRQRRQHGRIPKGPAPSGMCENATLLVVKNQINPRWRTKNPPQKHERAAEKNNERTVQSKTKRVKGCWACRFPITFLTGRAEGFLPNVIPPVVVSELLELKPFTSRSPFSYLGLDVLCHDFQPVASQVSPAQMLRALLTIRTTDDSPVVAGLHGGHWGLNGRGAIEGGAYPRGCKEEVDLWTTAFS